MTDLTVVPGRVIVNSVHQLIDHTDVKVWIGDLATKYADISLYGSRPGEISVFLGETPETLNVDMSTEHYTEVKITGLDDDKYWSTLAEVSRYTLTIVTHRMDVDDDDVLLMWERKDDEDLPDD